MTMPFARGGPTRHLAVMLIVGVFAGCTSRKPTAPHDLPDVEGQWNYSAWEVEPMGSGGGMGSCEIPEMRLEIGPWRWDGFTGRSSSSELVCSGDLAALSGPLPSYPIRRGGAVSQYLSFDLGTPAWRHEGTLDSDEMTGTFVIREGRVELVGQYRATRIRR